MLTEFINKVKNNIFNIGCGGTLILALVIIIGQYVYAATSAPVTVIVIGKDVSHTWGGNSYLIATKAKDSDDTETMEVTFDVYSSIDVGMTCNIHARGLQECK